MSKPLADTVRRYLECWGHDEPTRRATLREIWQPDAIYCDPLGRAEGLEAFVTYIGEAQLIFPNHELTLSSGVDEHAGGFRFLWQARNPSGELVIEGIDFGVLGLDGRIASITGFFGQIPATGA